MLDRHAAGTRPASRATALVVCGSDEMSRRLRLPLQQRRIQRVLTVSSTEDALCTLMQRAVDVIVASTDLPGLDALALAEQLRERGGPPLVVAHRRDQSYMRTVWIDAGAADCVLETEPADLIAARCAGLLRRSPAAVTTKVDPWTWS